MATPNERPVGWAHTERFCTSRKSSSSNGVGFHVFENRASTRTQGSARPARSRSIGTHFGVPPDMIAGALSDYVPSNNRSQLKDTGRNQLVLDAYNANPTSMAAALENFAKLPGAKPKLAILGDMLELGGASRAEHTAIAALVDRLGLQALLVGKEFMQAVGDARCHADAIALAAVLKADPPTGKVILVKGSRGIKLETVVGML